MNNLPTVSDTKRAFYSIHTRPINSIYRRVVEELMVEMHLLRVNEDFHENAIFALGVTTTYDRFMEGYTPEQDQGPIFEAICRAQDTDSGHYRQLSEGLRQVVQSMSQADLVAWLTRASTEGGDDLQAQVHAIATNPKFKYSRLFGVGLVAMLECADADALKDTDGLKATLTTVAEALKLPETKLQRDVELYCSNLEKMTQTRQAMADIVAAERKRREKADAEAAAKATAKPEETPPTDPPATADTPESASENITP